MKAGLYSGLFWGISTVILSLYLSTTTTSHLLMLGTYLTITVAFLHDCSAALWMWGKAIIQGNIRHILRDAKTRNGRTIMISALLGGPIGMCGYVVALTHLGPALAAILAALEPALSSLGSTVIHHERRKYHQWCGLAICVISAILASFSSIDITGNAFIGFAGGIICVLGWSGEVIVSMIALRISDKPIEASSAATIRQSTSSMTYLLIILPILGLYSHLPVFFSAPNVCLIAIAGGCGALAFILYYRAIAQIGAGKAVCLNISYIFWVIILTSLVNWQIPAWQYLCAATCIFVGAFLMNYEPTKGQESCPESNKSSA